VAARGGKSFAARLAGVSVATVSRALTGSPLVTAETRERVEAAVRRTGYAVNPMARGLRRSQAYWWRLPVL